MSETARPSSYPYPAVVQVPDSYVSDHLDQAVVEALDEQKVTVHGRDQVDNLLMIGGSAVDAVAEPAWRDRLWIETTLVKPWVLPDGGVRCRALIHRNAEGRVDQFDIVTDGDTARFDMDGSTAVMRWFAGRDSCRDAVVQYVRELPFVQAVSTGDFQ